MRNAHCKAVLDNVVIYRSMHVQIISSVLILTNTSQASKRKGLSSPIYLIDAPVFRGGGCVTDRCVQGWVGRGCSPCSDQTAVPF